MGTFSADGAGEVPDTEGTRTMSRATRPVRTIGAAIAAAALTAALATGCEPDSPATGTAQNTTNAAPPATPGAPTSAPGKAATTVQIGKTLYWGGLKFEVKSATYKAAAADGSSSSKVVVDTTVTNTFKTEAVRNWPDSALDIAGTPVMGDYGTAAPPTPGASNPVPLTFTTNADPGHPFSFDGASLVLGDASETQAVAPLGTGGREAISLKPIDLKLPGDPALTSGRLSLNLKYAQLRADTGSTALKRGQRALLVVFDMTGHVGPAGMAVSGENLRLKLPNGQVVGPTAAPIEALYPDRPTRQDQAAWFSFDGATDGDYTFSVTDTDNNTPPATVTLPATGLKDSGPLG